MIEEISKKILNFNEKAANFIVDEVVEPIKDTKQNYKFGKLTVVNDQRGNPTNAADLAHHIIKLLDTEEYGVYDGTGAGECSWYDFAVEIVKKANIDAEVIPCTSTEYAAAHPDAADRPKYSSLDNRMLRVTVGDEFREWKSALNCFMKNASIN